MIEAVRKKRNRLNTMIVPQIGSSSKFADTSIY